MLASCDSEDHVQLFLTRFKQLDSLGVLAGLRAAVLLDVVVDLSLRHEGGQSLQNTGHEVRNVGGGSGPGVGQGHVYHEDIGQDTGEERERGGKFNRSVEAAQQLLVEAGLSQFTSRCAL